MGSGLDLPFPTDTLPAEPADSSSTKASGQNAREVGGGKTIAQVDKSQPQQEYHPEPTPTKTATPTPTPTPEPLLSQKMVENEVIGLVQHELRQMCVLDSIYMTQNLFSPNDAWTMGHTGYMSSPKDILDGVAPNEKFYEQIMPPRYRAEYKGDGIWLVKFVFTYDEINWVGQLEALNGLYGVSIAAGEWEVYEDTQSVFALPNPWMSFLCGGIAPLKESVSKGQGYPDWPDSPTIRKTTPNFPDSPTMRKTTPVPATR